MANYKNLILFLLALSVASFSYAGVETLFDRHGFAIYPASNAVSVQTTSSVAAVASNGSRAVVPVTTAVNVSKATMALNAARLARTLSPIGAAFTAYAIYDAVQSTGVATCPPPDFFCMPPVAGSGPELLISYNNLDPITTISGAVANAVARNPGFTQQVTVVSATYTYLELRNPTTNAVRAIGHPVQTSCTNGATAQASGTGFKCNGGTTSPSSPGGAYASDQALADAMAANDWGPTLSKKIWDGVAADMGKSPSPLSFKDALGSQSPVTVSGSPVAGPQVTTSTKTSPNSDGSTSTEVRKEQTTFTPAKDGSTVADAVPKVSQTTVVTTTTTNNTTNVTNTTTETLSPPAPASEQEKSDLCKDNPDIVACKKLGTLEATPVPNENKPVAITSDSGWGASNGSCPAPGSFTAMGNTIPVPWDVFCQFAQGIRPFLIAVAYMIAVGGFIGLSRKD